MTNMPSEQVNLQNWCIYELDTLLCHYEVDRSMETLNFLLLWTKQHVSVNV